LFTVAHGFAHAATITLCAILATHRWRLMALFKRRRDPFQGFRLAPLVAADPALFHFPEKKYPDPEDQDHREPVDQDSHPVCICEIHRMPRSEIAGRA
ncbi:MAG TPA: hypothetical protein VEM35_02040, partial [Rhizomicrobium sp.]|nr:hypothetical protein [Rhizomicrobium sp.]